MKRAAIALLLVVAAACGASSKDVRGIVVDVDGDLLEVRSFTVRTEDGETLRFTPAAGAAFEDGTPLSHLTEHLREVSPVVVTYEEAEYASLVATVVEDG